MKNKVWFSALIVSLCAVSFMFIYGCGNATGGGGGGGGGVITYGGRLSDPYIASAEVIVDVNGNHMYDPLVTGEMLDTTEADGSFSFPSAPQFGSTIEMITAGTHLGTDYPGALMRNTVGSDELYNITPLTDWGSKGISDESIAALIGASGITIAANAIGLDPMANLAGITTFDSSAIEEVKKIKASIYAYSVSRIAEDYFGTSNYNLSSLEGTTMKTIEAAIAQAVNSGISDTILVGINNQIDQVNISIEAMAHSSAYNMPHATADQISRSAFNIAEYIAYMKINESSGPQMYDWTVPWTTIPLWGQALGMRYYFRDNYNNGPTIPNQPGNPYSGLTPAQVALKAGDLHDAFGTAITSSEVNPSVKAGYRIITASGPSQGSIESF